MNLRKQNQLEKREKKLKSAELTRQTHGPGNKTEITL